VSAQQKKEEVDTPKDAGRFRIGQGEKKKSLMGWSKERGYSEHEHPHGAFLLKGLSIAGLDRGRAQRGRRCLDKWKILCLAQEKKGVLAEGWKQ